MSLVPLREEFLEVKYTDYTRIKGPDPVVHLRDVKSLSLSVCKGSFGAATMDQHYDRNAVPTCFWCIGGSDGSGLQWFQWGVRSPNEQGPEP